jgi:excinuclease ABC subunit C
MNDKFNTLKDYARRLTSKPGVYCMINRKEDVIYVGKAKNLKKRVISYFTSVNSGGKKQAILKEAHSISITITRTEREALILENTLIKKYRPKFNVLLKDSKSYPYIEVNITHQFPRFSFHRGKRNLKRAEYYGPYPNVSAVRNTLSQLQKVFLLRNCDESFFNNRSRPCLQFQIKRCSGPCVDLVSKEEYQFNVDQALDYLKGNDQSIIKKFIGKMDQASAQQDYEKAGFYRDQISSLKVIQSYQFVDGANRIDADAIALTESSGMFCIAVLFLRKGQILGSRSFYPQKTNMADAQEVIESFLMQYYTVYQPPKEILLNIKLENLRLLQEAISDESKSKVIIKHSVRSYRKKWIEISASNAIESLKSKLASKASIAAQLYELTEIISNDKLVQNIECFDVSHFMGDKCVASCVAFNQEGFNKQGYRRFNISGIKKGDDYAAMSQALSRHYSRSLKESRLLPDIILVDGGKGQINTAISVFKDLGIIGIPLLGIAKGPNRQLKEDRIFINKNKIPLSIANNSPAKFLIQSIRDEAHRFAITGHRNKKRKKLLTSDIQSIEGIGPNKKKDLLKQFGGIQEIKRASVEDLMTVRGINNNLANKIYNHFNAN